MAKHCNQNYNTKYDKIQKQEHKTMLNMITSRNKNTKMMKDYNKSRKDSLEL